MPSSLIPLPTPASIASALMIMMSLAPPPTDCAYGSVSEALTALNAFAAPEGYAIVKKRSRSRKGILRNVDLKCDKGCAKRAYISEVSEDKQRTKSSRLTDCPFSMELRLEETQWKIHLRNGDHNHTATRAIAHPTHRQLSSSRRGEIERQCDAGIAPRQTHTSLLLDQKSRAEEDQPVLLSDINNARFRHRALKQGPRIAIQALIEDLQDETWYSQYQTDPNSNVVKRVFFAYQKSINLFRNSPEVLLMDCTYNTNRFNMPLFTITGITSMSRSFTVGMAFLGGEKFEEFQWVLHQLQQVYQRIHFNAPCTIVTDCDLGLINAVKLVFPSSQHLLCLWHISKNISTHCRTAFLIQEVDNQHTSAITTSSPQPRGTIDDDWNEFLADWHGIVQSRTIPAFETNWKKFCQKYERFPAALSYLRKQWLPHKEHIIYAWTNQRLHFNTRVTSRAEGLHGSLKKHLLVNIGDLKRVHENITHFLDRQVQEHDGQLERSKTRLIWDFRGPFFDEIRQWVTPCALREILKQRKLIQDPPLPCTGQFQNTMGLPCSHKINQIQQEGRKIQLSDIYEFWHYNRPHREPVLPPTAPPAPSAISRSEISSLQNPPVLTQKGRPKGSKTVLIQSTARHPSHFELVDGDLAISNKRRRQRSPSLKPPKPPTYQYSTETAAILAEIRSRKPEATPDPDKDQEEVILNPIVVDNPSPRERAIMELERQQIFGAKRNNTTPPPPLWATLPEFAGMTRAATATRPRTPKERVPMDLAIRRSPNERSPTRRPPPLARRSPSTTRSGRTSKPAGRVVEAQARVRAEAEANDQPEKEG